ncbi:MAG: glycosyltransferase family 4 protein, partial [Gammaproteobacteria bacterium]|nr:glycosyltransferase family 4 protein [Gammaproteobacteria bacterium]
MKETIVIFGDDPRGFTGFGRITNHLADAVTQAGFTPVNVALKSGVNTAYAKSEVHNVRELGDPQGWKTLEEIIRKTAAKTVISIGDPWDLQGVVEIKKRTPFRWIGCTPVDYTPYSRYILLVHSPQQYLDVAYILSHMDHVVTYSDFGRTAVARMLEEAFSAPPPGMKLPGVTRIYLGVDTQIYRPRDKVQARAVFSGAVTPEMFLFSCVKVNSMRAGFDTLLEAWAKYLEKAR